MDSLLLNGLELNGVGQGPYFLTAPVEGLDDADRRITVDDRSGEDGASYGTGLLSARLVTLQGMISAPSVSGYRAARRSLVQAVRLQRDTRRVMVEVGLQVTDYSGNVRRLSGVVRTFKAPETSPKSCDFLITIVCADPLIYGVGLASTGAIRPPSGTGITLPVTLPMTLGASSGGSGVLFNEGEADSPAYLTYRGALTNPYLYSVVWDTVFQLNVTTGADDVITVDMRNKVILRNGTAIMAAKSPESDWFGLAPGANPFRFSSGSSSDTGTVEVSGYPAYTAV